jgi:CrcB protein
MFILKSNSSLAVAVGAIFGALTRFYTTEFAKTFFGKDFAYYGTFFINVTGCFLIAYILTIALEKIRNISPELRLMTTTGFCGAYTTFSSYTLEAINFLDKGEITTMLIYFIGSVVLGMLGIKLGVSLARGER